MRLIICTLILLFQVSQPLLAAPTCFVLDKHWVVCAIDSIPAVKEALDELSAGAYTHYAQRWELSQRGGWNDWQARDRLIELRKRWLAAARERAGERQLDSPAAYLLSSPDDPAYELGLQPKQVTRFIGSVGGSEDPDWHDVDYLQYLYIQLPEPMQSTKTYQVKLATGQELSFVFDDARSISWALKVNQLGYLTGNTKRYAYLGAYLHELGSANFDYVQTFELRRIEDDATVFTGQVALRADSPELCGERIYELDFSSYSTPGSYYLRVPGLGRSWPFRIADDVYGEAFYVSARALYHQRAGQAIERRYSAWSRPAYHQEPIYESAYLPLVPPIDKPKGWSAFDIIGASTDLSRQTANAGGGWYDAADFDRRFEHYLPVLDLLYLYEFAPTKHQGTRLQVPESSNQIPDILDEAEQGLLVWKKSQNAAGGVAGRVETWTHAKRDEDAAYAYSVRTRWASLMYAAAAAQFSELVRSYDAQKAETYLRSARQAYAFGTDPKNSLGKVRVPARRERGKGAAYHFVFEEEDAHNTPFLVAAKLRLALATGEHDYLEDVEALLNESLSPFEWPFHERLYSVWLYFGLFDQRVRDSLPLSVIQAWRKHYIDVANHYLPHSARMPYRQSWPPERQHHMSWGSTHMSNISRVLLMAEKLSGSPRYREAVLRNADFMLGANPMGMSWITGLGQVYPTEIQHEISNTDGIPDPVPGIGLYGITEGYGTKRLRELMWEERLLDGTVVPFIKAANRKLPVWRRWTAHPYLNTWQNEFTVSETIAANVFVYGLLTPDGWQPPQWLRERGPRPESSLFGKVFLP